MKATEFGDVYQLPSNRHVTVNGMLCGALTVAVIRHIFCMVA